tara:strand:- start:349 stop:564 length:216 start_codon:yes stop_codon:yes gene_type:complete
MNAFNMIKDLIVQLTGLVVAAIGLGVVTAIVLPGDWFFGGVLEELLNTVRVLGENGLVGLLVAAILINLLK